MNRLLLPACLVLAVALSAAAAPAPAPVKTARVQRADVIRFVTVPGNLRANQQATLYAKVAGYLDQVAVDKGDQVKSGQTLANIEVPELIADLRKYQADAKVAEVDLKRLSDAQKKAPDLIVPQVIDKARGAAEVARANIERIETLLGFARIVAPFDGVISQRFVDNGAFVPAATSGSAAQTAALFTLMQTSVLRAQVAMPELEAALVVRGQLVKITCEALPGKTFETTVARTSGAIDEATRTMLVEADLPNPDGILRPGMYATVKIGVDRHERTLTIPVEALVMEKTNAFAFKVADGKARKTPLTLGFNDGARAEVLTGLTEADTVILVGKATFTDGQPVAVE